LIHNNHIEYKNNGCNLLLLRSFSDSPVHVYVHYSILPPTLEHNTIV
jgi:hypothetical protein